MKLFFEPFHPIHGEINFSLPFLYDVCHNEVYLNKKLFDIRLSHNLFLIQSLDHLTYKFDCEI
ncbi:hypothetical protein GIB67_001887, partial [Kingdonia uniflora]